MTVITYRREDVEQGLKILPSLPTARWLKDLPSRCVTYDRVKSDAVNLLRIHVAHPDFKEVIDQMAPGGSQEERVAAAFHLLAEYVERH